jgi:hypothetical protein
MLVCAAAFYAGPLITFAAGSRLYLEYEGTAADKGTPTNEFATIAPSGHSCFVNEPNGALKTNGKPTDKAVFTPTEVDRHCTEPTDTVTGFISQITVSSAGIYTITAKPKIALSIPGPCTYEASKLQGPIALESFGIPHGSWTDFFVSLKRNARVSGRSCAKTLSAYVETGFGPPPNRLYELVTE